MSNYFFMPNTSIFGAGCLEELGSEAKRFQVQKYLIMTDKFLASTPLVGRIADILAAQGLRCLVFDGVEPNPSLESVEAAYDLMLTEGCDGVISIGGGSAHDCAKAVCILMTNPAPLTQYVGVNLFANRAAPLIAVNTTAGTASEITNCFLITDKKTNTKLIFEGVNALSCVAINDPELMLTLPKGLTAATGMDALTHAIECFVSTFSYPLTNELALVAADYVFRNLPEAVEHPEDISARDGMCYAEFMAGMAFGNGGVGLVHAIAHQLGGVYCLPHGLLNAILLPYVITFNQSGAARRYQTLYQKLTPNADLTLSPEEATQALVEAIFALSERIGTRVPLRDLGVKREDFRLLAEKTLQDSCCDTNPVQATVEDIIKILENAY